MNGQLSPQFALYLVLLAQIFGLCYALTMLFVTALCIIGRVAGLALTTHGSHGGPTYGLHLAMLYGSSP